MSHIEAVEWMHLLLYWLLLVSLIFCGIRDNDET